MMNTTDKPAVSATAATSVSLQSESIIDNLRQLSHSLSALQQHIASVRTSINSSIILLLPKPEPEFSIESDPSEDEYEAEVKSTPHTELEVFCETMNSRSFKKYMVTHISDTNTLRQQVPKALKLSPNPARLVLECIGRFYYHGSKGYDKCSQMIPVRKACVLALECFLLMIGEDEGEGGVVEIEKWVKDEAEQAALAWLKRLISEGGVVNAYEIDAEGLLLLIACFGIPKRFRNEDIRDLLQVSYLELISVALRRSRFLMARVPKIIEGMLKNEMVVDAVHVVYCFGMEDTFSPQELLTSFLRKSEESLLYRIKGFEQGYTVCEAKKKHFYDLKSVMKCLERHKIDPSKLLPEWKIDARIITVEKDIADLSKLNRLLGDQKMARKRKIDETESSRRYSNKEVKRSCITSSWSPQHQRVVNHVDSNNTLLESGGTAGHKYGNSLCPLLLNGPVAGSVHENVVGSLSRPMGDVVAMGGPGASMSPSMEGTDTLPSDAYRPPLYFEGSPGLSNTVPSDVDGRISASNTSQFASIVELP